MTKIIITIAFTLSSILMMNAQESQSQYAQGMGKAFQLWGEGKNTEASAMFERIASAEPNNYLPNYYVALVNTTASFQTKEAETVTALLTKAQDALDVEMLKDQNNSEILVLQALIYTGWVVLDPMTNGQKYSPKIMELYDKAQAIDPKNPRAVAGKAEYEIGGAQYFGTDTKPMCAQLVKSIELFNTFKPETPFSPKWGLERAQEALKGCK